MAYRCLQDFLKLLEENGELHRIGVEVDPDLEIAEITDRVCKMPDGGKALLFERIKGSVFPVATNIFGSYRRVCLALGVEHLNELTGFMEGICCTSDSRNLTGFAGREAASGPCQEVTAKPNLADYPFLKSWPGDGGRFITLPLVFTRDPDTGEQNCGMYRVRIFDGQSAGIHWSQGSGGAGHAEKYRLRNEQMPVAIVLGGDPAAIWAATLPLPENIDELAFAGCLRREPVEVVRCLTNDIMVPAHGEMVIEGFIDPVEVREEGAFGNHTGYYAGQAPVPVFHISCITHRREMIYPATVVGPPPMEDCYLAKATERLLLPLVRREIPALVDISLPLEGIFHGCAIIAIRKEEAEDPRQVMESLWQSGRLGKGRLLVVVDEDVAVADWSQVMWKMINNADWSRDVTIHNDRMGIDATAKTDTKQGGMRLPIRKDPSVVKLVEEKWRHYGW